ncbi:Cellulose synthase-like protein D1 [Sesamum angolense]|uniref:Cellulose synthase-like protein D1 n=1 Tax=Sesamum angolense TaxID=2727404 RepID=A0AAE2BJU3_9LAMI|nr:Cellulose synthase-like protein D1 [Sesamum angolense]
MTKCDTFRGTAAQPLSTSQTVLYHVLRWAGSMEIIFSRNNALLATSRIKFLPRTAYINHSIYPFASIFLVIYCFLRPLRLFTEQFIVQTRDVWYLSFMLIITVLITLLSILEIKWARGPLENEDDAYANLYRMTRSWLLVIPLLTIALNVGTNNWDSNIQLDIAWSKLLGGAFFTFCVLAHMYPFAKGLKGEGRVPTVVFIWISLLSVAISLIWIIVKNSWGPQGDATSLTL